MKLATVLSSVLFAFQLWASDAFAPISPEVWAIRKGPMGAVVLEERFRFQPGEMETIYRVRIFSEEGRGAAELSDVPKSVKEIVGRTVYPDGRVVTFDSRKDFAERTVETGRQSSSRIHLVVPGVTTDCVVEVRLKENSDGYLQGLPKRFTNGYYGKWWLGNAFPTNLLVVEISKNHRLAHSVFQSSRLQAEVREVEGFKTFTFRNVPAAEKLPFALLPSNIFPRLEIYWQPDELIRAYYRGSDAYWLEAFDLIYKDEYEKSVETGRKFRQLAEALVQGLPAAPHAKARELLTRLDAKIRNVSYPTDSEQAALPKTFWEDYEFKRLDKAVERGLASSRGMRLFYYHLLKAAGIQPMIGKVVDREADRFSMGRFNPWQFDHDLLGVPEPGLGTLWLDPGNRFASPGVIHPDYQDTQMLVFEPVSRDVWKVSQTNVPVAESASNLRDFTYSLELGEQSDHFDVKASFAGFPEWAERSSFLPMGPPERVRVLKERFEGGLKNLVVAKADVSDVSDPSHPCTWHLEGTVEQDSGWTRTVEPFPAMPWPLLVPDRLDSARSVPIVLPHRGIQRSVSTFEVPAGHVIKEQAEIRSQNRFGHVLWTCQYDPATRKATITFETAISSAQESSTQWAAFKAFLGWVEEACRRKVTLVREARS